jgi:hypothetical protein
MTMIEGISYEKVAAADNDADKDDLFGFMASKGKIIGDIVSPAISPGEWGDLY